MEQLIDLLHILHDLRLNWEDCTLPQSVSVSTEPKKIGICAERFDQRVDLAEIKSDHQTKDNMIQSIVAVACLESQPNSGAKERKR